MPLRTSKDHETAVQGDACPGFIFEYVDLGDAKINNSLVGDYKNNKLFFFAFNVNWK